nr:unnamed protein product [Spirometra erinaceieuropaei]
MLGPPVSTRNRLSHQHVPLVSPPDRDIFQQVPLSRPRVHPGGLLSGRESEVGRPASTSRPTELANKRPFNQTRSSILRSQLAEQRRQEASRPPSFPTTRSRRDQPSASATRVSRPVPARRTQTPTSRRASPSGGPRSMTSAHSCPRGQPAGEEAVPRPTTNFVQGQQSSGTVTEEVQIPVTTTNPKESNQRRATTVTGLPTSGSSCSLGPPGSSFRQALSEEEKSREARRKAGEAAILRALQADAHSATLTATVQ